MKKFCFDHTLCVGCEGCAVACKQVNMADVGQGLRMVRRINERRVDGLPAYYLSFSCNHCDEPKCVEVCPQKAIYKREDGVVILEEEKCDGCRECMGACPYEAIRYDAERQVVLKCNMCAGRLEDAEPPLCVQTCPTGALTICDREKGNASEHLLNDIFKDMNRRKQGRTSE